MRASDCSLPIGLPAAAGSLLKSPTMQKLRPGTSDDLAIWGKQTVHLNSFKHPPPHLSRPPPSLWLCPVRMAARFMDDILLISAAMEDERG